MLVLSMVESSMGAEREGERGRGREEKRTGVGSCCSSAVCFTASLPDWSGRLEKF